MFTKKEKLDCAPWVLLFYFTFKHQQLNCILACINETFKGQVSLESLIFGSQGIVWPLTYQFKIVQNYKKCKLLTKIVKN